VFGTTLRLLQQAGFAVVRLAQVAAPDTPDDDVIRLARERSLILLTNDKDFCDILRYPPSSNAGIIVLRITAASEPRVHQTLLTVLANHPPEFLRGALTVITASKYRIRR
jgi:predicted nuclease of predicted toxin-antitoxin system